MKVISHVYDYVDELGVILYQQVRYLPKEFKARRPDPIYPSQYIGKLRNPDGSYAVRLVLYRLNEVIANKTVHIVEGEKDADTLHKHGLCGTTNAFGAESWRDEFNPYFQRKRVFIIPDNDKAGWKRAVRIAAGVAPFASELSVLALPAEVKDITEWFEQGHSADALSEITERRCGND